MTAGLLLGLLGSAQAAVPPAAEPPSATTDTDVDALRRDLDAALVELAEIRAEQAAARGAPLDASGTDGGQGSGQDRGKVGFGVAIEVPEGREVDEVVSFGDDVHVAGHVLGDAISFGGDVRIGETGRVDGDAVSFGGVVDVETGGRVTGNRVAMDMPLGMPPVAPEGARPESNAVGHLALATDGNEILRSLYRRLVWTLSVAGAGVLVVGLFPSRVTRVAQDLEARPVRAAIVGTLASLFLAVFSVLFVVVTLGLGFPVSMLLMGVLGVAWLLGFVGLCQAVGDRLPGLDRRSGFSASTANSSGRWVALLVGVLLLTFLSSLPWIGWMVIALASTLGIGAALSTRFGATA